MTKETWLSIIRSVLTLAGSYLVGHSLFGAKVDQNLFQTILGAVLALIGICWGIFDKSIPSDQLASAIRSAITSVITVFVASGKITSDKADQIIGLIVAVLPVILSQLSKAKVVSIANGTAVPEMKANDSGQVVPTGKLVKPGYA